MPDYLRTGVCEDCGDCCGGNGMAPTSMGYEAISRWNISGVGDVWFQLWFLFGLAYNPVTERIEPESTVGLHKVKGKNYYYVWQELRSGKGHLPCKDTSIAHDGSSYSVECPFLMDDSGDGTRPCALKGSQDGGYRGITCRPEERTIPPLNYDIWTEESKSQWQADHPNCSYVFTEIVE